uniref:Uncharacterized protein n=2 Tax=Rhodococcus TaxID=1827 RepID=Q6XMX5_RHOER|nr:hypothetical protein PBD2.171 [Rhodococcus erythropolis]
MTPIHDGRVGRAQRTGESGRHTQSQHRECPVASLAQARGRREMGTVEFLRQGAQRGLGLERRIGMVGVRHIPPDTAPKSSRQMIFHVSYLV